MKQKDKVAERSIWKCPVCRNKESSDKRPDRCHICGAPGERLTAEEPYNNKNEQNQ